MGHYFNPGIGGLNLLLDKAKHASFRRIAVWILFAIYGASDVFSLSLETPRKVETTPVLATKNFDGTARRPFLRAPPPLKIPKMHNR